MTPSQIGLAIIALVTAIVILPALRQRIIGPRVAILLVGVALILTLLCGAFLGARP
jgi:multisubunit Na+/H+ antiporter MnhB subunit